MEGSCMDLALEGERLCKAGDCRTGVQFFESAIQVGTDDLKTLSAIYSQLGNAYFYLQEYGKALEYHKHDLNLARSVTLRSFTRYEFISGSREDDVKGARDNLIKNMCCESIYDINIMIRMKGKPLPFNLSSTTISKGANNIPPPVIITKGSLIKEGGLIELNIKEIVKIPQEV